MENLTYKTKAELIAALSVFVKAGKDLDKLLDLRKEKLSRAIYKSPSFTGHGNGKGKYRKDKIAQALAEVDRIDKQAEEIAGSFTGLIDQVQEIINKLYPNYKQMLVMEWRYINGAPWEEISINLGLSLPRCYDLHDKALKALLEKGIERKEENE